MATRRASGPRRGLPTGGVACLATWAVALGVVGLGSLSAARAADLAAVFSDFTVAGYVAAGGSHVEGPPGWLEGGFGRLPLGGETTDAETTDARGDLHLTIDWLPSPRFGAFVHATARAEPTAVEGRAAGVVEAYLHGNVGLGDGRLLRLRLGHFFLPTSRENPEIAWSSPYTLTFSALNSWIGEEVRPTGLWAEVALPLGAASDEIRLGGSLFGGNDTSGALVAWRGWALHDRLTVFEEHLPLPPLASLAPGGDFASQTDRGTRPYGHDLDDRLGWVAQARWQRFERAAVVFTHYDNRADRRFYGSEYAWENDFDLLGAEWHSPTGAFSLLAEGIDGATGMGPHRGPFYIQADYRATYLLASWSRAAYRLSLRRDDFDTEHTHRGRRFVGEEGDAWTVAALWEPTADLRLAAEVVEVDARRPGAVSSLGTAEVGGTAIRLEARYYFGLP